MRCNRRYIPYNHAMNYLLAFIVFGICIAGMAIGLFLLKKPLTKGCSVDPNDPDDSCYCRDHGIDPSECEQENKKKVISIQD